MLNIGVCSEKTLLNNRETLEKWGQQHPIRFITIDNAIIDKTIFNDYISVPKTKNEITLLNNIMQQVNDNFLLLNGDFKILEDNFNDFLVNAMKGTFSSYATLSPAMYNSHYPYIAIANEEGISLDKIAQLASENATFALQNTYRLTQEITGNPYMCYYNYEIFQKVQGFQFTSYKTIKEVMYDYFFWINDAYYINGVIRDVAIYQEWKQNTELEKIEHEQQQVLKKYTNQYLSYEPIFHFQKTLSHAFFYELQHMKAFKGQETDKNILFINPSSLFVNGLNTHVLDLVNNIADTHFYSFEPTFSINESKYFELIHYFNGVIVDRIKFPYNDSMHISNVTSEEYRKILKEIIKQFNITAIHVHIMALGHTLDAPSVAKELGIPVLLSLHDLYYLSGEFTQRNTDIPYNKENLQEKYNIFHDEVFYQHWHQAVQEMFDCVDLIIGFSQSTIEIYKKWYKLGDKATIIPHGYDYDKRYVCGIPYQTGDKVKFVYFGRVEEEKGSDILWKIATKHKDIELHILGVIADKRFQKRDLPKNIIVYGKYKKEDLPLLLQKIQPHSVILPSVWDETFGFTLTEAYLYGLYPLVSNRGAFGERVEQAGIGYIFDFTEENFDEKMLQHIRSLSVKEWQQIYIKMEQLQIDSVHDMAEKYVQLYKITKTQVIAFDSWYQQQQEKTQRFFSSIYARNIQQTSATMERLYDAFFVYSKEQKSRGKRLIDSLRKIKKSIVGEKNQ